MTRPIQRYLRSAFILVLTSFATPLFAQQDCAQTTLERNHNFLSGPDCTISWIDNNQLRTVTWRSVSDDVEPAHLTQNATGWVLTSRMLPGLIDVDRDGWQDLVTFTPVGIVNGTFDVFFADPDSPAFKHATPLSGHTLEHDMDDYIVEVSRNGPGQVLRGLCPKVGDGVIRRLG